MPDLDLAIAAEPYESADVQRLITALDRPGRPLSTGAPLRAEPSTGAGGGRAGGVPDARRSGAPIGCGALLARLEDGARRLGVRRLNLETGVHQEAAIGLHRRAGFEAVECWGEYRPSPTSVCFEKQLGPPAGGPAPDG